MLTPDPIATNGAPAPQGGRSGVLVLTAGPVPYFYSTSSLGNAKAVVPASNDLQRRARQAAQRLSATLEQTAQVLERTAILAYKLAQLDVVTSTHGRPPLLLLDDVFSELDPDRRAHLVRRIAALPQSFVTTTTADDLDPRLVAAATGWEVGPDDGRGATLRPVG